MARNARVSCPLDAWTKLTNGLVSTNLSVMLANDVAVSLQATSGTTAPTDDVGPLELMARGNGWSEATILEKFPGVATADTLWAKPRTKDDFRGPAIVSISHA